MKLIHEIGLELRSSAVCTGLRRIRYGHFTLTHALLTKHCDARSIAENIEFCLPVVSQARQAERSDVVQTDRKDSDLERFKIIKHSASIDHDDNDDELDSCEMHMKQDIVH